MSSEALIQHAILKAWGAHKRLRIARVNTGVAYFNDNGPCRRKDPGARPVRFNPPGTADIVGVLAPEGRMVMIEVKAEDGKQRDAQVVMERVITSMGGLYVVARSLEEVDAAFAAIGVTR